VEASGQAKRRDARVLSLIACIYYCIAVIQLYSISSPLRYGRFHNVLCHFGASMHTPMLACPLNELDRFIFAFILSDWNASLLFDSHGGYNHFAISLVDLDDVYNSIQDLFARVSSEAHSTAP